MEKVKVRRRPKLVNPCLVAAWPGVGNVALIAATYLRDKLGAKELGRMEHSVYFEPGGVFIKDNIIELPKFPENRLYYWRNKGNGGDMLILLAEEQPAIGG